MQFSLAINMERGDAVTDMREVAAHTLAMVQMAEAGGFGIVWITFDKASGKSGSATPTIYAGTANNDAALYRSTDAGKTWALVPNQPKGMMASHGLFDSAGNLILSYGNGPGPGEETTGGVYRYDAKKGTFANIAVGSDGSIVFSTGAAEVKGSPYTGTGAQVHMKDASGTQLPCGYTLDNDLKGTDGSTLHVSG